MKNLGIWEPANEYTKWLEKTSGYNKSDRQRLEVDYCYCLNELDRLKSELLSLMDLYDKLYNQRKAYIFKKDITPTEIDFASDYTVNTIMQRIREELITKLESKKALEMKLNIKG